MDSREWSDRKRQEKKGLVSVCFLGFVLTRFKVSLAGGVKWQI